MRSFAVIAGFAAAANAYAYGYPAYNTSSSAVESSSSAYETKYTPVPVSSKYEEAPAYTTKVVTELTTVCPEPTTITYGTKTYTVSTSTTLTITDCPCTVTEPAKPTKTPVHSSYAPPPYHPAPYPSQNSTKPHVPAGPTGTGYPTTTKPTSPEFTGAAAQAGVGLLAVAGALAAFL